MAEKEVTLSTIQALLQDHTARFDRHETTLSAIQALLQDHNSRFDRHETTLSAIQALLQDHNSRFNRHETTLSAIQALLQDHNSRFDRHDATLSAIQALLQDHTARFDRMETTQNAIALRLIKVETTVGEHSSMLRSLQVRIEVLHGLVEELERRTGRIEQEYVMITEALRRLENRFDKIEADRLKERIAALEARVQALETA